jgi:hypothetical protein
MFAELKQSVSELSATDRKVLFVAHLIQSFCVFKSYSKKEPLSIAGTLFSYSITSQSKGVLSGKRDYINQLQTFHTRLGYLGLKLQRNYVLINNIRSTHQINENLSEIQCTKN